MAMDLPPGFRFHPTDEEIITHYLSPKVINPTFSARAIGEVDLNKCEPWDLPSKAKMGEKEWYFFCQRDRKYPTGMRTNRATESGYWKATGKDKEIYRGRGVLVGMKKTLVFYRGRAPKGEKTNWVMHEYRLDGCSSNLPKPSKDEWVVCRVFHKGGAKKIPPVARIGSFGDLLDSPNLPPLTDSTTTPISSGYGGGLVNFDNSFDFKGPIAAAPLGFAPSNYFSNMVVGLDDLQPNNMFNSSNFYCQNDGGAMGYLHHQQQMGSGLRMLQCKLEQQQLPNHSMVSDDTGLSTDRNTEISSSVVSRHDIRSYEDLDVGPGSAGMDLDSMWKC